MHAERPAGAEVNRPLEPPYTPTYRGRKGWGVEVPNEQERAIWIPFTLLEMFPLIVEGGLRKEVAENLEISLQAADTRIRRLTNLLGIEAKPFEAYRQLRSVIQQHLDQGLGETIEEIEVLIAQKCKPKEPDKKSKEGDELSPREEEVLTVLVSGTTKSDAIAQTLGISRSTLKNHFTSILKKLGVTDKTQAALLYLKRNPHLLSTISLPVGRKPREENNL